MRTTRALFAEVGGLTALLVAAVIGVFVIAAAHVPFDGWMPDIPRHTLNLFGDRTPAAPRHLPRAAAPITATAAGTAALPDAATAPEPSAATGVLLRNATSQAATDDVARATSSAVSPPAPAGPAPSTQSAPAVADDGGPSGALPGGVSDVRSSARDEDNAGEAAPPQRERAAAVEGAGEDAAAPVAEDPAPVAEHPAPSPEALPEQPRGEGAQ